jgi:adenine-specific DNA-methyltransferase
MNEPDIMGIAALLNSSLLDQYFRISNGNTQVSAAELRVMPLPPLALIKKIGEKVRDLSISDLERLNGLVEDILNLNLSK